MIKGDSEDWSGMGWNGRVIRRLTKKNKQGQIQKGRIGVKGNSETGDVGQEIAVIGKWPDIKAVFKYWKGHRGERFISCFKRK